MQFFFRAPPMPTADNGPPRPRPADQSRRGPRVLGASIGRPLARRHADRRSSASAASGATRRTFWQRPASWITAVGYAGGFTPNPTYQEVCSEQDRARRGRPRRLRPVEDLATSSC